MAMEWGRDSLYKLMTVLRVVGRRGTSQKIFVTRWLFPANRNRFCASWRIKQVMEIKMDMDGGQVTTWEADRAEGQVIQCPFQQALLGAVPPCTAEAGR